MTIQDPIFGTLEYNGGWTQKVYVPMFDSMLSILEHGLGIIFYQDQIGVADAGAHWLNHDRYDLQGKLLYLDGEE
jgi:hypothetical protein